MKTEIEIMFEEWCKANRENTELYIKVCQLEIRESYMCGMMKYYHDQYFKLAMMEKDKKMKKLKVTTKCKKVIYLIPLHGRQLILSKAEHMLS